VAAAPKTKKQWTKLKGTITTKLPFHKNKKVKPFLLTSMLPNLVTLAGLCAGLSSIRFALLEKWEFAVLAILIAALLDTLDGALARLLSATSRFGAELDSLADFATFGVCPAVIMYLLSLRHIGSLGWVIVLWFSVCGALRLARFNTRSIEGTNPTWGQGFFTGVPITSSALLCLFPLVLHLAYPNFTLILNPFVVGIMMAGVGFLMISTLPTFSLKKVVIPPKFMLPLIVGLVITAGGIISSPWHTASFILLGYVLTFPVSYHFYKKLEREVNSVVEVEE